MRKILILLSISLLMLSCSKMENKSDAYGIFEATEITISAKANGELLSFEVEEGESLNESQYIGQIDTVILKIKKQQVIDNINAMKLKVSSLKLNLEAMMKQKELLLKEKNRIADLYSKEAATEQNRDKIFTEHEVAILKTKALQKDIESLNVQKKGLTNSLAEIDENLRYTKIINPVCGTVLVKYKEAHELVSTGIPLYKLANLNKMYLKIYISATQLDDIKIGQKVEVLIDMDKKSYHNMAGNIIWISAISEFTPKNIQTKEERVDQVYAVKVLVKNDGKIKIGMPGEVNFKF